MLITRRSFCSLLPAAVAGTRAQSTPSGLGKPITDLGRVFYPGLVFDDRRQVSVLFGGLAEDRTALGTWHWNGREWTRHTGLAEPPPRAAHEMVFDSSRGRVVLFGGFWRDAPLGDTWEYDGRSWSKAADSGPAARGAFGMAFDTARARTVMFGGSTGVGRPTLTDTWEWSGDRWTQAAESGPSGNSFHKMAFDQRRSRTVSFGGRRGGGETWEWDGRAWKQVATKGPSMRDHHAMTYDVRRNAVLVFGGSGQLADGTYPKNPADYIWLRDLWRWDGLEWVRLADDGPPSRGGLPGMSYDAHRDRVVLVGGGGLDGTWEWNGTVWQRIEA